MRRREFITPLGTAAAATRRRHCVASRYRKNGLLRSDVHCLDAI